MNFNLYFCPFSLPKAYIITMLGETHDGGVMDFYALFEKNRGKPSSELEQMILKGNHPGKHISRFSAANGWRAIDDGFDPELYKKLQTSFKVILTRLREDSRLNATPAEKLLALYALHDIVPEQISETQIITPENQEERFYRNLGAVVVRRED